jgi:N,N-dimethylformamidase
MMTGISSAIPPHRAILVPGLHAYASSLSVFAGEEIAFHVSSTVPYAFSLRQLGPDVDDAGSDPVLHALPGQPPNPQPIHPGSYVAVDDALPHEEMPEFSLECWVKFWEFGDVQTVLSQSDRSRDPGFALRINAIGRPVFACGEATLVAPELGSHRWVHLASTFARGEMAIFVDGKEVARGEGPAVCVPARAPLRIGAGGRDGLADEFLDADIAMPAIHGNSLAAADILARWCDAALHPPAPDMLLGCWPLAEQSGDILNDVSRHRRTGRLVNHGTWMVPGPRFDASRVPRFAASPRYDPKADPLRGQALRFASDDLVDCRWTPTHCVIVPSTAQPGIYVGRFDFSLDGTESFNEVSFVVKRARGSAPAPFVVLCATNTWLAYGASPFARNTAGPVMWPRQAKGLPSAHPLAPDNNTYTLHRKGQPTYFMGLRMPRPNASPRALYAPEGAGFSQFVRLERHLHTWLDRQGYRYDVVTDLDLHRDPGLLAPYRTVIVNGHSEYWSASAIEGLDAYLRNGGSTIVLSGNTMFWRVSFDDEGRVMEQRKTETPLYDEEASSDRHAAPGGVHGEQYHSQDGERGGLWRFNGRSSSEVIGLESAGWAFAEAEDFGVYRVKHSKHFLFHTPLATGLGAGATFGHGPGGRLPRAVGHEWDLTIATLRRMTSNVPADAKLPRPQEGIVVLAEGVRRVPGALDAYLDFFERASASEAGLSAEMIYWERPNGGRVFNAGAVGASWVLHADPMFAALLANVLACFGVPVPNSVPS